MELALAIGIVGTLAVVASWHTAYRRIRRHESDETLERLGARIAEVSRRLGTDEAEREVTRGLATGLLTRVDILEKRLNDLAAHAAMRAPNPRERRQA
jgi:hypothetical protein